MNEYSKLSVLIVDPNVGMRGSLHNMLAQVGVTKIEYAVSSGTAIKQIAKQSYDIILCEYDLGNGQDGQDGQQLLEDLRHHKLIGMWTIYIMITSESVYSKVVSAAELGPTDYVLKPFTVETLVQRIARAVDKRKAFLPVYQLIGQGRMGDAIRATEAAETLHPRHAADFARLRAELQLAAGDAADAERTYAAMLAERPLDWARLGVAKAQYAQRRYAEAAETLTALLAGNERLMDAYDWLARTHVALDQPAQAQRVLEAAVGISPHVVRRLRTLGAVALQAGDAAAAERSYRQVVAKARYSEFRDPEDHVNLVKAMVDKGDTAGAAGVVRDLDKSLRGHDKGAICHALAAAVVHGAAGKPQDAGMALEQALEGWRAGAALSGPARLLLAQVCLEQRKDEPAFAVLDGLADDPAAGVDMDETLRVFNRAGRSDLAAGYADKLRRQVEGLLATAASLTARQDYRGAAATMLEAARRTPGDARIGAAAMDAVIDALDRLGWDGELDAGAQGLLARLRGDERHDALHQRYRDMQRKYGIAA